MNESKMSSVIQSDIVQSDIGPSGIQGCNSYEYLDENTNECSLCSEICGGPTYVPESCARNCAAYLRAVSVEANVRTPSGPGSDGFGAIYMAPIAAASACVAVVTIVLVILLIFFRRYRLQSNTEVDQRSVNDDDVPFLSQRCTDELRTAQSSPSPSHNTHVYKTCIDIPDERAEGCSTSLCSADNNSSSSGIVASGAETDGSQEQQQGPELALNFKDNTFASTPDPVCNEVDCLPAYSNNCCVVSSMDSETDLKVTPPASVSSHSVNLMSTTSVVLEVPAEDAIDGHGFSHNPDEAKRQFPVDLVSFDIDSRMKMFGWLNSQPWVVQYFEEIDRVRIAVNIDRDEARNKIQMAASHILSDFEFEIIEPLRGRYIACPQVTTLPGRNIANATLKPGVQIFSPRMEPTTPSAAAQSGRALYSGSICGVNFPEHGLTVAHLFDKVGTECMCQVCGHAEKSVPVTCVPVGKCAYKLDFIDLVNTVRRTTADLALMHIGCRSLNIVNIDGRSYVLQLYRDVLDIRSVSEVAILSSDGQIRRGRVTSTLFTIDSVGLFNTVSIVDPNQTKSTRVNNPGDSGALVISVPDCRRHEVLVYGMVIGYYESDDGCHSYTVATRLWDILEQFIGIERSTDVDFAPPHMQCSGESDHLSAVVTKTGSLHSSALESGYATMK